MKKDLLFILLLVIFSCKNEQSKITKRTQNHSLIIEEIGSINDRWITGNVTYWIRTKEDSIWTDIQPNDTLTCIKPEDTTKYTKFWRRNKFNLVMSDYLSIEKNLLLNPFTENKISETIIYSRKINENVETRIGLIYNYSNKTSESFILDSIHRTKKKKNELKLDNMSKHLEKNSVYLCQTAFNEISRKKFPKLNASYRAISLDSALLVINKWKKQY
ncbi:hypothetical protein [Aquimarina litoralis]|uniref:hypothetical protein n=1 Tax=Aquimarina litoralis TaxID=584605 RepID=UPI001C564640|nr:hypothetical protein [Aquimarina litoralis]MBW1296402.1 hypothetical protein [Aquimarina litoralis]